MPLKRSGFKKKPISGSAIPRRNTGLRRKQRNLSYNKRRDLRDREQALARQCRERDGYKCQWPGGCQTGDTRLDAHHIAERSQRPDLKFELSNLITICRTHHDWIPLHRREAIQMKLLSTETYEFAMKARRDSFQNISFLPMFFL